MGMIMSTFSTVACKAVQLDNTQSCIDFLIYIGMAWSLQASKSLKPVTMADGAAWLLYPNKRGTGR